MSTLNLNDSLTYRASSIDFHNAEIAHDRVLLVEDQKFYVKSEYLCRSSHFFKELFASDENQNKREIEIKDVSAENFYVFLKVIYPGHFEIQESHLKSLLELSIYFAAEYVVKCCDMFILKDFDNLDKVKLLKLAFEYGWENAKNKSLYFILENVEYLNQFELLKLACELNLEKLKKVTVDLLMKKIDHFNTYQTAQTAVRNSDNLHKNLWKQISDNAKAMDPMQLYEIAVENNLQQDFKNKIMVSIGINLDNFNPIQLLKFAFKHNSEELKKKLRYLIYTSDRIELFYRCNQCTDRIQRIGCQHIQPQSDPIQRNAFIAEHIDEICNLPKEIKDFVIVASIRSG